MNVTKSLELIRKIRSRELVRNLTLAFWKLLWVALDDFMLKILIVSAVISIAISMVFEKDKSIAWVEGGAILVAVAVVSLVTAVNDYKKESQFIALNKFSDSKNVINVRRGGTEMQINIDDLKVGDLAKVTVGMQVPCDAILV